MRIIETWLFSFLGVLAAGPAWALAPGDVDRGAPKALGVTSETTDSPSPLGAKTKRVRREAASAEGEDGAGDNPYAEEEEAAEAEEAPPPRRRRKAPRPRDDDQEENALTGLECSPAVSEVELRRPIPVSCSSTRGDVERIEIRYKAPGKKRFTKLTLKKRGTEWTGQIPCTATAKRGSLKLSFSGRNESRKVVAKINTVTIRLVEESSEAPPSFPGESAPARCFDSAECPPEFKGTPACPGTKPGETVTTSSSKKKGWGRSCSEDDECRSGFACIDGACEQPPKCEENSDCPKGGECSGGVCEFPSAEEIAGRFKPKNHWFGFHYAADLMFVGSAQGVCRQGNTEYQCYLGGDAYEGPANDSFAGDAIGGMRLASQRVLVSYEYWFGRFAAGARVGVAFGGPPKNFSPFHLEGRLLFSILPKPLIRSFRPYLGVAGGLAQTEPGSTVELVDCRTPDPDCQSPDINVAVRDGGGVPVSVEAYQVKQKAFVGPTLGFLFAISNGFALQANLNLLFPSVVIQPSAGLVFGL